MGGGGFAVVVQEADYVVEYCWRETRVVVRVQKTLTPVPAV